MTDESGKLSEEEKNLVVEWLNGRSAGKITCPVCGDTNWFIGDHIVAPITQNGDGAMMLGGVAYPQVMLVSTKCGNTLFINAVMIGVAKAKTTEGVS